MKNTSTAGRREIGTLTGMAIGFRAFLAAVLDGSGLMNSTWLALLTGGALALPAVGAMALVRRFRPKEEGGQAICSTVGRRAAACLYALWLVLLIYDGAASLRLLCSTVRYVAMPESNRVLIMLAAASASTAAVALGTDAAAGGAVLWKKLMAVLIVLIVLAQARYFRPAWITPVLGPGGAALLKGAVPLGGIFSMAACGWLMMEPDQDEKGGALVSTVGISMLTAAALAAAFAMITPLMQQEPELRSFRLGRLLGNARSGLSLELPYVTLLFGGMLTMLTYELAAAVRVLELLAPRIKRRWCAAASGLLILALASAGLAEREYATAAALFYYPLAAAPALTAGICALILMIRRKRSEGK